MLNLNGVTTMSEQHKRVMQYAYVAKQHGHGIKESFALARQWLYYPRHSRAKDTLHGEVLLSMFKSSLKA